MKTKRDFIITSLQSWDMPIGGNAKDIAIEMSRHNRVLYVNPYYEKAYAQDGLLRQINNSLWVANIPISMWSVNFLPDGILFDYANRRNNRKKFDEVSKLIKKLHFQNYILFIDNDIYRSQYAKEYLSPSLSIYYRRDNLQPIEYWKRHIARLEPLLIKKCDVTLCNSEELMEYPASFHVPVKMVGQGVYLEAYNPQKSYTIPQDIASIPTPRIGYIGAILSTRLDAALIFQLAQKHPSYSFILVGEADDGFRTHPLQQLPNIYFLGQKELAEVPTYLYSMDICINPQVVNEVTIGNYPRKIDEYLAMGKPIVGTSTRTMQHIFSEYVHLAQNVTEFSEKLQVALAECNNVPLKEQRIAFAHTHSWTNSVQKIYHAIEKIEKTK
ncbi:MAG: glycosyltransferase [Bacteroidaceae bacterium]